MTPNTPTPSERAIARLQRYVDMQRAKPMRGIHDDIHTIHTGTEWEAVLRLSDLEIFLEEWNRRPDAAPEAEGVRDGEDAARYRWLRANANRMTGLPDDAFAWTWTAMKYGEPDYTLDAAIDAARGALPGVGA